MPNFPRRTFIQQTTVTSLALAAGPPLYAATVASLKPQRVTIAQIAVSRDIQQNMKTVRRAFAIAKRDKAGWLLFPEGTVSGYHGDIDQAAVAKAFDEIAELTRDAKLTALVGTSWRETDGRTFNQLRIIDAAGKTIGAYGKKVLTYGDAKWASPGESPLVFQSQGQTFGTLICNDLWVTPGFCDGPDPRLTLEQSRLGAHVIFQAISSGSNQNYKTYHESNLFARAAEARCPIITANAFPNGKPVNARSGVVGTNFSYTAELPGDREAIETVSFTPGAGEGPRVRP